MLNDLQETLLVSVALDSALSDSVLCTSRKLGVTYAPTSPPKTLSWKSICLIGLPLIVRPKTGRAPENDGHPGCRPEKLALRCGQPFIDCAGERGFVQRGKGGVGTLLR